ncbi:uncharacterized protein BCR38DRAFT_334525 [Pseudomassariella vexata]|uniref:LCCL domain-containing protein n=1 Tax=Pseudomassariella vexata TaxID=1141098 RepID=A0A1Y2EBW5_9PEZI|nr:uncharacterized protein BCR38DRAFT_334525 [Pseudomassariella vexata]ORY68756.1 hypothetical protein BCR38DRAFT_334525 [Pseudomassariella vexata]
MREDNAFNSLANSDSSSFRTPTSTEDEGENSELTPKSHYHRAVDDKRLPSWLSPGLESWLNGGRSPQKHIFRPVMPALQLIPRRWLDQRFPQQQHKMFLFIGICLLWCLMFAILYDTSMGPVMVDGLYQPVQQIDCTDSFWLPDNGCGIDGADCRPFAGTSMAFHCPSDCAKAKVQTPHHVGAQNIVNRQLVIGGPIYRGDSYICGSAIHAGIISDADGGCGIVTRVGQTNTYPSTHINEIESIAVRTYFPLSFKFQLDSGFECQERNLRWLLPFLSLGFTIVVFLFSSNPAVPFFTAFVVGFVHVSLVSDEPEAGPHLSPVHAHPGVYSSHSLSSNLVKLLPAALCATLIYKCSVRPTFRNLTAHIETTALWLGGFWIGSFSNHTFEWFPISRLAARDMELQRMAISTVFMALILIYQVYNLRLEGRLAKSAPLYTIFTLALIIYIIAPSLRLPIHYVVLPLVIMPGASIQTRASLFFQGLLVGLFVHGVTHQGFVPITHSPSLSVETPDSTNFPTPIPTILQPEIFLEDAASNITFVWANPVPPLFEGISMLVNDVERGRRYFGDENAPESDDRFEWRRGPQAVVDYVRFSYLKDGRALGYSEAGIWLVNGTWTGLGE